MSAKAGRRIPFTPKVEGKFFARVEQEGESPLSCWNYTGALTPSGYGRFYAQRNAEYAHRFSYRFMVGEIPDGLELDHLCRNRSCVNPWHLDPVTHRVNVLRGDTFARRNAEKVHCPRGHLLDREMEHGRKCNGCHPNPFNRDKTHCKRGHEFNDENTYWFPNGVGRGCRACRRMHNRRSQLKKKAVA